MPGIVGIISRQLPEECEAQVRLMIASMLHEPFYQCGTYTAPEMGIYAGWVAHENSFAANQVFFSENENLALLFSGECFLDSETEALLRRRGYPVDRNNGTWLVNLYLELGDQFFAELNGLFSGLLIDKRRNSAFLFNDRYGMERIYWHENNEALYFASEAKALLRVLPELRQFDRTGVVEFLTYGYTLDSRTLFSGIRSLPPSSLWSFQRGIRREQKYFSPEKWESQSTIPPEDFTAEFEGTFKRIVPRYLQPEAGLGISLTAGLDGRMIMACLPELSVRPACYTFTDEKETTLDARLAARVAAVCGLDHQTLRIGSDFFEDFASYADKTVYVSDGCLGVTGTHEIYMNEKARRLAPVRLTGVFGGEILREVSFSKPLRLDLALLNPEFVKLESLPRYNFERNDQNPITFAISREIPRSRFGVVAAGRSQTTFRTPYLDNELVALAYRLPPKLCASPAPGLSLIKNNRPALSEIPTDMGLMGKNNRIGTAARRIFARFTFKLDYFYNEGLPHALSTLDPVLRKIGPQTGSIGLHKFLRYGSWFREELTDYVNDHLCDAQNRQVDIWSAEHLRRLINENRVGGCNRVPEINAVLTLEAVNRLLLDKTSKEYRPLDPANTR